MPSTTSTSMSSDGKSAAENRIQAFVDETHFITRGYDNADEYEWDELTVSIERAWRFEELKAVCGNLYEVPVRETDRKGGTQIDNLGK